MLPVSRAPVVSPDPPWRPQSLGLEIGVRAPFQVRGPNIRQLLQVGGEASEEVDQRLDS